MRKNLFTKERFGDSLPRLSEPRRNDGKSPVRMDAHSLSIVHTSHRDRVSWPGASGARAPIPQAARCPYGWLCRLWFRPLRNTAARHETPQLPSGERCPASNTTGGKSGMMRRQPVLELDRLRCSAACANWDGFGHISSQNKAGLAQATRHICLTFTPEAAPPFRAFAKGWASRTPMK